MTHSLYGLSEARGGQWIKTKILRKLQIHNTRPSTFLGANWQKFQMKLRIDCTWEAHMLFSLESCIIMCSLWKHDYTKVWFNRLLNVPVKLVFLWRWKHRCLRTKFCWGRLNLRTQSSKEMLEYHSKVDNTSASYFGVSEFISLDALQCSSMSPDTCQDSTVTPDTCQNSTSN